MWQIEIATDVYEKRHRDYEKSRWRELRAVEENLATYVAILNAGTKPMQIPQMHRWVHSEPKGVYAITEKRKGNERNLAATRLYVYPDPFERVHLLTLGDKPSQPKDIEFCNGCVDELIKREARRHEQPIKPKDIPTLDQSEEIRDGGGDGSGTD